MSDRVLFRLSGGEAFAVDLGAWRDRLRQGTHQAAAGEADRIVAITNADLPARSGALRRGIRARDESLGDTVLFRVRSVAPHSHMYERGTGPRWTREAWYRGKMPALPRFVPAAVTRRAAFYRQVRELVGAPAPAIGAGRPTIMGSL